MDLMIVEVLFEQLAGHIVREVQLKDKDTLENYSRYDFQT